VNGILAESKKADILMQILLGLKLVNAVGSVLEKEMKSARWSIRKYAISNSICEKEVNRV
jgi:hypothetical protein